MVLDKRKEYHILVIEDNLGDFVLIEEYLHEVIAVLHLDNARSFAEAKQFLQTEHRQYDLILLDLTLPDKNGTNLINELLPFCKTSPLVVLTGYADAEFGIRSLSMGVTDYLMKDEINPSILYKSILYNIERKKASLELEASEKRYSALFHLSPQPMFVVDNETHAIVQVNNAAISKYERAPDEFLSLPFPTLFQAEDQQRIKDFIQSVELIQNKSNQGRFRLVNPSGAVVDTDLYATQVDFNGRNCSSFVAVDVTEKIQLENTVTSAIIKTQEDERYEIGGELHDNVCQLLASGQMSLARLKKIVPEEYLSSFDQTRSYIQQASIEIRNLSHRLAPAFFDDNTLEDTFQLLLRTFNINEQYEITFYFDKKVLKKTAQQRDIQLNLYRILQEQLSNILKYAKATKIEIDVMINQDKLEMRIADNGVGFDLGQKHQGIGITNMRRRAELFNGKLDITTSPTLGCEVLLSIPLKKS